jgi:hypothetical protein
MVVVIKDKSESQVDVRGRLRRCGRSICVFHANVFAGHETRTAIFDDSNYNT